MAVENEVSAEVNPKGLKSGALGMVGSVVVGLASTAPAYSLAASLGLVVATGAGLKAPAIMLLAFIPMYFIAVAYRELNRAEPDCGTVFAWGTRAFGSVTGWLGGWGIIVADVICMSNLAAIAGSYSFTLADDIGIHNDLAGSTLWSTVAGLVWIAAMTYICYRGIEVSARIQYGLLSIEIVTLVVFAVTALSKVYSGDAGPTALHPRWSWLWPSGMSLGGVLAPAVLAAHGLAFVCIQLAFQRGGALATAGTASLLTNALPIAAGIFLTWSATASYTLDLFGGERRTVEGLAAQRDRQRQLALAAYISLTGNVVNTAVAQASYAEEAEVLRQVIALRREQVDIAQAQAQAGTAPQSAVLSLQVQLAGAEAQLPQLLQAQQQAAHLLAVLGGRPPGEGAGSAPSLAELQLPERLPESLPSELVRQRPDVLAAEADLHARSAEIGVATAAMLPSLSLSGSYGRGGSGFSALGPAAGAFWSAGAGVTAPLFQGGTLWYQRRAAVDAYQLSLASYRQTVLTAFSQVADALRALEHDAMILGAQSEASAAADQGLELAQAGFRGGTIGYLELAAANDQALQARLALIQARAQRCQDTAALFVALGGGWWNAPAASSGLPQLTPAAAAAP